MSARQLINDDPAQAAIVLEEAVRLSDGNYPAAQLLWARSLLLSGQWQEAIGCFSLIKDPAELPGEMLLQLGDEARSAHVPLLANNVWESITAESAVYPSALERLMELQFEKSQWSAVAKLGLQLVQLRPQMSAKAILMIAVSYEQLLDYKRSLELYGRCLEPSAAPDLNTSLMALRGLQRLTAILGETRQSRSWFEKLRTLTALTPADRVAEASLLRLEGEPTAATEIIREVISSGYKATAAVQLRALLAFERGEWVEAESDFRDIVRKESWNKLAHYKLAQCLLRQGRNDEAERHFARNREINEVSTQILRLESMPLTGREEAKRLEKLAAAYERLGRPDLAQSFRSRIPDTEQ
ncbi:MAG: hypothetical protein R3C49_00525 [Planctomycetaceae bacterium]